MRASVSKHGFMVLMGFLIGLAWLALGIWGSSPAGRFLNHSELAQLSFEQIGYLLIFVLGWTLMTIAMMLPTSLPLIKQFYVMTKRKRDKIILLYLLLVGYLSIWALFGLAAHLVDWGLHWLVDQIPWLEANSWVIGASIVVMAGVYQFTPLKYHCLEKCRAPLSFIMEHWGGRNERKQSFWLGLHHGLFCLGCCWSLMMLMFAVGTGSLGWMMGLGSVMAIEKNSKWGRYLSPVLGIALSVWGIYLVVTGLVIY
jgi:predicted metal-binding membrane protein